MLIITWLRIQENEWGVNCPVRRSVRRWPFQVPNEKSIDNENSKEAVIIVCQPLASWRRPWSMSLVRLQLVKCHMTCIVHYSSGECNCDGRHEVHFSYLVWSDCVHSVYVSEIFVFLWAEIRLMGATLSAVLITKSAWQCNTALRPLLDFSHLVITATFLVPSGQTPSHFLIWKSGLPYNLPYIAVGPRHPPTPSLRSPRYYGHFSSVLSGQSSSNVLIWKPR